LPRFALSTTTGILLDLDQAARRVIGVPKTLVTPSSVSVHCVMRPRSSLLYVKERTGVPLNEAVLDDTSP